MKKELKFIWAFAETRGLEQKSFVEVYNEVCHWLREERKRTGWDDDTIIDNFTDEYNRIIEEELLKYYDTLWSGMY